MEVAGKVQQPRILCADLGADKADTLLPIPIGPARTQRKRWSYAAQTRRYADEYDN